MAIYDYPMYLTPDEIEELRDPEKSKLGAIDAPAPTAQASLMRPLLLLGAGIFLGYMVTKLSKNHLHGGVGDQYGPDDFDPDDLEEGTEVEYEHTDDPEIAQEIAIDHLTEDRDYYRKLKKMEGARSFFQGKKLNELSARKLSAPVETPKTTFEEQKQKIIDDPMSLFRPNPDDGYDYSYRDDSEEEDDDGRY